MAKNFNGEWISKTGNQNNMWLADTNWNIWGKELTVYVQGQLALVIVNDLLFIVWLYNSNDIKARAVWDNALKDGHGRIDFSAWHFLRNGQKHTIRCDNTSAIKVLA